VEMEIPFGDGLEHREGRPPRLRLRDRFGYVAPSAISSNRLIASDRVGFGSGWASIHAFSFASRSAGMRTPVMGVRPVGGRPRGLFCLSAIDPPLFPLNV